MKRIFNHSSVHNHQAPFVKRLIAYFIDWYIISVMTILPINLIYSIIYHQKNFTSSIVNLPLIPAISAFLIGLLLSLLYLVYFPYKYNGQTIGKKIFGLKIVKNNETVFDDINKIALLIRNGVGLILIEGTFYSCSIYFWELINIIFEASIASFALSILGIVSFISMFMSLLNSNHRMLHDYLSKTSVVTVHK